MSYTFNTFTPKVKRPCFGRSFSEDLFRNKRHEIWHTPAKGRFSVPLDCKLALGAAICNNMFFPSVSPGSPRTSISPMQKRKRERKYILPRFGARSHLDPIGNPVHFAHFWLGSNAEHTRNSGIEYLIPVSTLFLCRSTTFLRLSMTF